MHIFILWLYAYSASNWNREACLAREYRDKMCCHYQYHKISNVTIFTSIIVYCKLLEKCLSFIMHACMTAFRMYE